LIRKITKSDELVNSKGRRCGCELFKYWDRRSVEIPKSQTHTLRTVFGVHIKRISPYSVSVSLSFRHCRPIISTARKRVKT